jgi:hypothetical protein
MLHTRDASTKRYTEGTSRLTMDEVTHLEAVMAVETGKYTENDTNG